MNNEKTDKRVGRVPKTRLDERNRQILAMAQEGWSFAAIAQAYNISRQRVEQICRAMGFTGRQDSERVPTSKQAELYRFIVDYKASHDGQSPNLAQIVEGTSYKTKSGVFYALRALVDQGKIKTVKAGLRVVGVEVVGAEWVPPMAKAPDSYQGQASEGLG